MARDCTGHQTEGNVTFRAPGNELQLGQGWGQPPRDEQKVDGGWNGAGGHEASLAPFQA